jgi:hypothetical protein
MTGGYELTWLLRRLTALKGASAPGERAVAGIESAPASKRL